MSSVEKIVNIVVLVMGIGMIAYYLALGFAVRFGQSLQFLWLAVGFVFILRALFWFWAAKTGYVPPRMIVLPGRILIAAGLALFLAVEGIIFAAGCAAPIQGLDCIVVLGAKVNGTQPSGALRNRIQVAAEYLQANPDTIAVLSGGQGSDEQISEAACMYENMIALGIDPSRLILEDKSTDTSENLIFSRRLIPKDASVGLVTNNFHIYRSLRLAKGLGWQVSGIPVHTTAISFPHYMMREFIGVMYDGIRCNLG